MRTLSAFDRSAMFSHRLGWVLVVSAFMHVLFAIFVWWSWASFSFHSAKFLAQAANWSIFAGALSKKGCQLRLASFELSLIFSTFLLFFKSASKITSFFALSAAKKAFTDNKKEQKPKNYDRNGVIPFLGLAASPHPGTRFPAAVPDFSWDQLAGQGCQGRQDEQVIQVAQDRHEVRYQVNRRQGVGHGDGRQQLGDQRRGRILQGQG